ncbi:hypothetical protein [Bartonella sp. B1098]|uniref:hypothetical protein n=1 Tax=Bartonella sp. B1098 TaxID=2911421 RepID=UPI0020C3689A|nr:hypothetical protein [Bartonella sp. B1098]
MYVSRSKSSTLCSKAYCSCVAAWEAVSEAELGKSVKATLIKWLREHAVQYKLANGENIPREKLIEELAAVANWEPTGGAPPKKPAN